MTEAIPLEKLTEKCSSIYEAVVIIARRARQINEMQRRLIEQQVVTGSSEAKDSDEDEDMPLDRDYIDGQYLKLPKPTTIALKEMLEGKLSFEYIEPEG
ncbi:MAG: DNA-directed RNA polymerase subunit omega [candidate division KSB1 bacterium]|nr:DNA-directed RNA polymerase subunit omega [candidate division KSB1 bacterium]